MLRAIKTATRLLEQGSVSSSEGKGMLPRYLIVLSGRDLEADEGDGADVWLEDNDEIPDTWEAVSGLFGKVSQTMKSFDRSLFIITDGIGSSSNHAGFTDITWLYAKS